MARKADRQHQVRHRVFDICGVNHVVPVIVGIRPGKVEWPVLSQNDWTEPYSWALAVQHRDPGGRWAVEGRFLISDLKGALERSIPGRDEAQTL